MVGGVSYTVFARKYRPQIFQDVLGQEHITRTLRNAIEQDRIAHAYIFVGPRGTGKTSTARIFAKALNCTGGPKADFDPEDEICREIAEGRSLDVIEIDGASNNGVEQVRELRENVRFAPARGRYKIYIIDEVHMLSTAAFNALLKTLEEPPEHAKFMMATTDVQKVLPTILSRCQRFDLRRIPTATIAKHLLYIAGNEGFGLTPAAADAVARGADGGLRDAESMLDQLVAFCGGEITEADVLNIFGFTAQQTVTDLCAAILAADAPTALGLVHQQSEGGKDLSSLLAELISHFRNLLVLKADPVGLADELMPEAITALEGQAAHAPMDKLLDLIEQFAAAEGRMKWAPNKKMHFEVAVIKAIQMLQSATLTEVLETLTAIRGGVALPPAEKRALPPVQPALAPIPKAAPPIAPPPVAKAPEPPKAEPVATPPVPKVEPTKLEVPTPAPTPEPPAAAAIAFEDFWPGLITTVRRDRALISAWVEAGALVSIEAAEVRIAFPTAQSFSKDFLEQSHKPFLESAASALLGRKVAVRLEVRDGVAPTKVAPPEPVIARDPMEEFKDDPLIRAALEIFKAQLEPA